MCKFYGTILHIVSSGEYLIISSMLGFFNSGLEGVCSSVGMVLG